MVSDTPLGLGIVCVQSATPPAPGFPPAWAPLGALVVGNTALQGDASLAIDNRDRPLIAFLRKAPGTKAGSWAFSGVALRFGGADARWQELGAPGGFASGPVTDVCLQTGALGAPW